MTVANSGHQSTQIRNQIERMLSHEFELRRYYIARRNSLTLQNGFAGS